MGALCVSCSKASVFQNAAPQASANYGTEHDMNVVAEGEVSTSVRLPPQRPELDKLHNTNSPTFCSDEVKAVEVTNNKAIEGDYSVVCACAVAANN